MQLKSIALITDNRDLALDFSLDFTKTDTLALILESPKIWRPDRINEILRTNNILAFLRPNTVVFGALDKEVDKLLTPKMRKCPIVRAKNRKDWSHLVSKREISNDFGSQMFTPTSSAFAPLIAYVFKDDINDIIIQNLAVAMNARLVTIKSDVSFDKRALLDLFYRLEETKMLLEKINIKQQIDSLIGQFSQTLGEYDNASSITFITERIPIGIDIRTVPICHLTSVLLGHQISRIVLSEVNQKSDINAALLIDPGDIQTEELRLLSNHLIRKNCIVKRLFGENAIAIDVMRSIDYQPYDLCVISTHCGEVGGREMVYTYTDKGGNDHMLKVLQVESYAPHYDKEEMVTVQILHIPLEIDGVQWKDKTNIGKIGGGELLLEFVTNFPEGASVKDALEEKRVPHSQSLKLYDQNYMPRPQGFDAPSIPIIINNSCFSSYEMADYFMYGGGRGYIGTINSVQSWVAEEFINQLFSLGSTLPIATQVWMVQRRLFKNSDYFPYRYTGLPFSTINYLSSSRVSRIRYHSRLNNAYNGWKTMLKDSNDDKRGQTASVVKFLEGEIESFSVE